MDDVDDIIAAAEHEWRAMGIVPRERATLADDLRRELRAAEADGIAPRHLVGDDVRAFARSVATAAEPTRLPYEYRRLLLAALAGATPGLLFGWVALWGYSFGYGYLAAPVIILVGALLTVRHRMRDVAAIDRTVWAMAVLVPVAGILITPVTMGFAALTGYSTTGPVLLVEAAIVAAAVGGATVLARRWALAPALATVRPTAAGSR